MAKKRILIVEDEPQMAFMVKMRLEANNYEVLTAGDGQEGLDKAKQEKPDLIILDLMLPKIDGFKVCRILKFDENYKHIPIILFTARTQKEDTETGKEVGADAYVTKPFDPATFLAKVSELINK